MRRGVSHLRGKKTAHRASTAVIPSENFMNQRAKEF
jgi:hypothetical protein